MCFVLMIHNHRHNKARQHSCYYYLLVGFLMLSTSFRNVYPWTINPWTMKERNILMPHHCRLQRCCFPDTPYCEMQNANNSSSNISNYSRVEENQSASITPAIKQTVLKSPTPPTLMLSATTKNMFAYKMDEFLKFLQLIFGCMGLSILLISWEDVSMSHPMRKQLSSSYSSSSSLSTYASSLSKSPVLLHNQWGLSTVRGLGFGGQERQFVTAALDFESNAYKNLLSYNEVMLKHRTDRIPLWNTNNDHSNYKKGGISVDASSSTTIAKKQNVMDSVRIVQLAVLRIRDCEELAKNYDWDQLSANLNDKLLRSELTNACYLLKSADGFLSKEARDEIGFDWGSCAWRHCGALSDAQEAIDELDHHIGMLEPFECIFCLDVIERSLRDILAVTTKYHDDAIKVPEYIPIQRMNEPSLSANDEDQLLFDRTDSDYMKTLSFLRNSEF